MYGALLNCRRHHKRNKTHMDKLTKLSQAIRLGATFRPQCVRASGTVGKNGELESTCALGAAMEAIGVSPLDTSILPLDALARFKLEPFVCGAIILRNDLLGWTREQIADWLEQQGL